MNTSISALARSSGHENHALCVAYNIYALVKVATVLDIDVAIVCIVYMKPLTIKSQR